MSTSGATATETKVLIDNTINVVAPELCLGRWPYRRSFRDGMTGNLLGLQIQGPYTVLEDHGGPKGSLCSVSPANDIGNRNLHFRGVAESETDRRFPTRSPLHLPSDRPTGSTIVH